MNTQTIKNWHKKRKSLGVINWNAIDLVVITISITALLSTFPLIGLLAIAGLFFVYPNQYNYMTKRKLQKAIREELVHPHYQARIGRDGKTITGCEALARISKRNEKETYLPSHFMETALNTGLITKIDQIVVRKALRDVHKWLRNGQIGSDFTVSFNVDRLNLVSKKNVLKLIQIIEQSGLPPSMIEMEITEHSLEELSSRDTVLKNVQMIKDLTSIKLAIDDFSIGHSSAISLLTLPVDTIKIDKEFASMTDEKALKFLSFLCTFGREIGCSMVFEGIENLEQYRTFDSLGINIAEYQGYLFHRPTCTKGFEAFLLQA